MALSPNEDRIFVRPNPVNDKVGSLWVPESAKQPSTAGVVIAVGPGAACRHCGMLKEAKIEIGWTVLYVSGAGYDVILNGEALRMIRFADIQAYDDSVIASSVTVEDNTLLPESKTTHDGISISAEKV